MGKDKKLNIITNSQYTFATACIHGAIYRERGLLTAEGKTIKNKEEIKALLAALWLPKKLAIIHCLGHQKSDTLTSKGNNLADRAARDAAQGTVIEATLQLPDPGSPVLPALPNYSPRDLDWIKSLPMTQQLARWWKAADSSLILPEELGKQVLLRMHHTTHLGTRKMQDLIRHAKITVRDVRSTIENTVSTCKACQLTNAARHPANHGSRERGSRPGAYWEVDFTEVKPGKCGYKYLLVFIDTFSGWVEAFPTKRETAQMVAEKLIEDILPLFGFPAQVGSDNGPAFVSQVSQGVAQALGARWKLHCAYRPQSSGQVER